MDLGSFRESLKEASPPEGINTALKALWFDAKGDWKRAHEIAQDIESKTGALIHAYLHRKEGDTGNARYWYSSAGRPFPKLSLEDEWEEITVNLLSK